MLMAHQLGALIGGVGLCLLGMWLMTEGLRLTAGTALRDVLALAGFGVLFLGIDVLRDAFTGLAAGVSFPSGDGFRGVGAQELIGVLLTLLMQSSSAATALILTAAQGGLLGLESAAAVVIGSNIGTTGTALIAAIGATANARRAAAAHVLFNVLTGGVALLALPWLLGVTQWLGGWVGVPTGVATVLALFHSVFNLLGVLLMWPLSLRLAAFLAALDAAIDAFVVRLNRASMTQDSALRTRRCASAWMTAVSRSDSMPWSTSWARMVCRRRPPSSRCGRFRSASAG